MDVQDAIWKADRQAANVAKPVALVVDLTRSILLSPEAGFFICRLFRRLVARGECTPQTRSEALLPGLGG